MENKTKFRNFCFTLFNFTNDDKLKINNLQDKFCNYIIYADEICPTTGREHLQGYLEFIDQIRFSGIKRLIHDEISVRACKGSFTDNFIYCSKTKKYYESGKRKIQGKRNDLIELKTRFFNNERIDTILNDCNSFQQIKIIEKLIQYKKLSKIRIKLDIIYITGECGSGKTEYAYSLLKDDFWRNCPSGLDWFDGYVGQEDVLINEFRDTFCKLHMLLELLDGYELKVPIKGGFTHWYPKRIIFTSIYPPEELYSLNEIDSIQQLLRRIKRTIVMKDFRIVSDVGGNTSPNN